MIYYNGMEVAPSFRIERGEVKQQLDQNGFGLVLLMHPYDICQHLAEAGNPLQALNALAGFSHRYADILADAAIKKLHTDYP